MSVSKSKKPLHVQQKSVPASATQAQGSAVLKWAPVLIILFTALLYSNTLGNQLTSFDDDFYLEKNPFLKDFSWAGVKAIFTSFYSGNYHPFTTLTYLFEYTGFGLDPFPYHLL